MQATTRPLPDPEQPPRGPAVVEETGTPKKPARRILWVGFFVAVIGAIALIQYLRQPQAASPTAQPQAVRTATLSAGALTRTIRATGQTTAVDFTNIRVPRVRGSRGRGQVDIIRLAQAGTLVKKGDLAAQIDAQPILEGVDDAENSVVQAEMNIRKREAQLALDSENLQQTLRVAKAELDKATLDASASEIWTEIDRELLNLYAQEAQAYYKQVQADLEPTEVRHRADMRILEISRDRTVLQRDRTLNDLKRFSIMTPMDGLVVRETVHRSGDFAQVREGDQVRPGQSILKIVDLSTMRVDAYVSQTESSALRVGQTAIIGLDAYPELRMKGKIHSIGALGVSGSHENFYVRTVPIRIRIEGTDPKLIPDLSAWADIQVEFQESALLVPLEAIHVENGKTLVYVKQGDSFIKKEVELGLRNHTHAAVVAGVEAGQEVALDEPLAGV